MALLRFLCSIGELSPAEAEAMRRNSGPTGSRPVDAVCAKIGESRLARLLSEHLDLPLVDLPSTQIEPAAVARISRELATRYDAVPIREEGGSVVVALIDPLNTEGIKALEFAGRFRVRSVVATRGQVREAIRHIYAFREDLDRRMSEARPRTGVNIASRAGGEVVARGLPAEGDGATSADRVVQLLLDDGIRLGASEIQIEPGQIAVTVRYRVNGVLEKGITIPKAQHAPVVARIKAMALVEDAAAGLSSQGRFRARIQDHEMDVRVACLPSPHGERLSLRLHDRETGVIPLACVGLDEAGLEVVRAEARRGEGLIVICGPIGCGRSTTAHAVLDEIAADRRSIATIEDPIERRLPAATQLEVDAKAGILFADGLETILRQNPAVVLVGEMRDPETARSAVRAAQSGHLVLATLQVCDAVASIGRLRELGVDSAAISASLRLVLAQRLVQTVCSACRRYERASDLARARFGREGATITSESRGGGCERCRKTGFSGRSGIFEVLPISPTLASMIGSGATEVALRVRARAEGVRSLQSLGIAAVIAGRTSLDELVREIPPEDEIHEETGEASESDDGLVIGAPASRPGAANPSVYRILVVDDDPVVLALMTRSLGRLPVPTEVLTAASGDEALALLEREEVHFAILDVSMEGMSGVELCERIRAQSRHARMPIFMLTARDQVDSKATAFRAGADDYLIKPLTSRELVARVLRAIARTYDVRIPDFAPASPPPPSLVGRGAAISAPGPLVDPPARAADSSTPDSSRSPEGERTGRWEASGPNRRITP